MGFFDKLKGELIDIIEWLDDSNDLLVWRYPRYNNEIKYGAKLVVRETQIAVFIREGKIADTFLPGTYTLTTKNLPILSTIMGWYHGFESPFKSEIYFLNTKNFTNLKWGTTNSILLKTNDFGAVRLKAYGSYVLKVGEPTKFLKEIVGTNSSFSIDGINDQLRNIVVSRFSDLLGESKINVLDLASNYDELSDLMEDKLLSEFQEYGLDITKFLVESISLPKNVEEMLDKKTSMNIIGDMDKFNSFQGSVSMEKAANNPSGEASGGIGMGMGFAMANQMANQMGTNKNDNKKNNESTNTDNLNTPPPIKKKKHYYSDGENKFGPFSSKEIYDLIDNGTITNETLYWQSGMNGWKKAKYIKALKLKLDDTPPPL